MSGEVGAKAPVRWLVSALSVVLVLIAATFVGANLVTADPGPGVSPITVTFNYNGATGGTSVTSATVTPGVSADSVLPFPTQSGLDFSGWFNTQSLLNGQRITTIGQGDAGQLQAGYVPGELAAALNLDLPPPPSCANGYAAACSLGETGPGGGLVFLISGGKAYEMAPKTWSGGSEDPTYGWCNTTSDVTGAASVAVGVGASNTAAMDAACTTGAGRVASALVFGGKADWFLPSKDELFEMYSYSLVMPASVAATYAFVNTTYWSSTQNSSNFASTLSFLGGSVGNVFKTLTVRVRPIRSF